MNRKPMQFVIVCLLLFKVGAFAQSEDVPKYEIAAEFITLERGTFVHKTEPGAGARFTFNFNRNVAIETAGYFFPNDCHSCSHNGNMSQAVAGVKVGKRFEKWGIFAKGRPGVVSFSRGEFDVVGLTPGGPFPFEVRVNRITEFATDLGGVLEFYPSRRIVTRFDVGDTIIHFRRRVTNGVSIHPITGDISLFPVFRPARTTHNFQLIAGVGFRF